MIFRKMVIPSPLMVLFLAGSLYQRITKRIVICGSRFRVRWSDLTDWSMLLLRPSRQVGTRDLISWHDTWSTIVRACLPWHYCIKDYLSPRSLWYLCFDQKFHLWFWFRGGYQVNHNPLCIRFNQGNENDFSYARCTSHVMSSDVNYGTEEVGTNILDINTFIENHEIIHKTTRPTCRGR